MNVLIRIDNRASGIKAYQGGSFPLRGKKSEQIALEFWKQIKKEVSYRAELEKISANGEDLTQLVKDLEERENMNDLELPF
jgi:hypothetical protein